MDESKGIVESQNDSVSATENIFNDITKMMSILTEKVNDVKQDTINMGDRKNELVDFIENLSATFQETSASTEEISSSTEEQLASIEEVNSHSHTLEELAKKLEENIDNV